MMGQSVVDTLAGGTIGDKTPMEIWDIFEKAAQNTQQKASRGRRVNVDSVRGGGNCDDTKLDKVINALEGLTLQLSKKS